MVKSRQKKGLGSSERRKRVKYACKPELQELIEFSNTIPPDFQLQNITELSDSKFTLAREGSPEWIETYKRQEEDFLTYLKTLPEEFQGLMHAATNREIEEFNKWLRIEYSTSETAEVKKQYWLKRIQVHKTVVGIYERFKWVRENLYKLAKIGENVEEHVGKQLDVALGVLFVEYAYLDDNGKIRRQPDKFTETLEGVEISRLRTCLVCQKLFWANRKDKKCCSEIHSAVIRQRQSREVKKERGKVYSKVAKRRKQRQKNETSVNGDGSTGQKGE
jgi:hypothetical protein